MVGKSLDVLQRVGRSFGRCQIGNGPFGWLKVDSCLDDITSDGLSDGSAPRDLRSNIGLRAPRLSIGNWITAGIDCRSVADID